MKKLLHLIVFLLLINTVHAQFESRYDFGNAPPLLDECDALGKKTGKKFAPPAGASFKITNMYNSDTAIGTCLLYGKVNSGGVELVTENDINNYVKYNYQSFDDAKLTETKLAQIKKGVIINIKEVEKNRSYFLIKVADLTKFSTPFYQTWHQNRTFVVGAQTNLLKIRLKNFNFADQFSLATNFGFRYRTNPKKDNFLTFITSIGISLNNLDSLVAPKLPATEKLNNIGSLSVGLGIIKEFNKIQLSFMLGKDFLSKSNNKKYDWIYQGKTWISFGIGIGIFTNDDGKKSSMTDKQTN
jgi:hypothetical protein